MKTRIYVDTSVVGGCVDEEFQEHSIRLMGCFVTEGGNGGVTDENARAGCPHVAATSQVH